MRLVTVADGKDVWRTELGGDAFQVNVRPLTGTDLLVAHSDDRLYLLDRADGAVKETYTTEVDAWYGSASDGSLWYLARTDDEQYPRLSKLRSHDPADAAWTTELATMPFMVRDTMVDVHGGHAFVTEAVTGNVFRLPSNTLQRSPEAIAALTLSDGTIPDWSRNVSLTWFDDVIVTASTEGTVTGLGEDGGTRWEASGQRALNLNGALIVSTPTSVSRLDPATGGVIWEAEVEKAEQFAVIGGDLAVVGYDEQGLAESSGAGLVTFLDVGTGKQRSELEVVLQTFPATWRGEDQLLLSTRQGEAEKLWAISPDGKVNYTYTTEEEMIFADAAGSLFAISKETITRLR
nr:PQQ-binding-like beta-propeller repeat protein [Tessaracoccus aquimaris]